MWQIPSSDGDLWSVKQQCWEPWAMSCKAASTLRFVFAAAASTRNAHTASNLQPYTGSFKCIGNAGYCNRGYRSVVCPSLHRSHLYIRESCWTIMKCHTVGTFLAWDFPVSYSTQSTITHYHNVWWEHQKQFQPNNKNQNNLMKLTIATASPLMFAFTKWQHRTYGLAAICNCMFWLGFKFSHLLVVKDLV